MPQEGTDDRAQVESAVVVRKYVCPYACGKAYRNSNGLSYHLKKSRCSTTHQLALIAAAAVPASKENNNNNNNNGSVNSTNYQPAHTSLATTAQKRKKKTAPTTAEDNKDDGPVTITKKKPRSIATLTEETNVTVVHATNGYPETPVSSAHSSSVKIVADVSLITPPLYPSTSAT
jgi:hypothetical protein